MIRQFLLLTIWAFAHSQSPKDDYYMNWQGKIPGIETKRLLDIVFPGSRHAGMYPEAIEANNYEASADDYHTAVIAYAPGGNEAKMKWTQRQKGDLRSQLNAGSRFLDIRLESNGSTVYAHNGLLGASLATMLADIKAYLDDTNYDQKDIIILSFTDFLSISDPATDVWTPLETALSAYMSNTSRYNIAEDSISTLLAAGVRVIPLFAGTVAPTNNYVLDDSDTLLVGDEIISPESNDIVLGALANLISPRDTSTSTGQLNQVFYGLNLNESSAYTKYSNLYASYAEFNADLAVTLQNTITSYPKLFFGNAIIVDFIETSSVTDQAILLNYNYRDCRDNVTMDCATPTDLGRDYKTETISTACDSDSVLLTNCPRSCGDCAWLTGEPGSACDETNTCDGDIYDDALVDGVCFTRPPDTDTFINKPSFCLAPFSASDCGSISSDVCSNDVSSDSGCTEFCNMNFQCTSGYCNANMGVCMEITTPAPVEAPKSTECYCPRVTSDQAVDFRGDIAGFRPGDPDGDYAFVGGSCNNPSTCNEVLDENPYIKSLVGFIIIPFILSVVMYIMYFCCCCCWCTCGNFWKKKCCRCCLGEPEESLGARYGPSVVMGCILIVILWACVEGMSANQKMHNHVFAAEPEESLRTEMIGLFDVVIDKFAGIGPQADWIVDNVKGILGSVDGIINGVSSSTAGDVQKIYRTFNYLSSAYDNYSLTSNVTNPFNPNDTRSVAVPCDYCSGLGSQISGINDTFKSAVSVLDNMKSLLNNTGGLVEAEDQIDSAVGEFKQLIENFTSSMETYKANTTTYLDEFEGYDEQREQAGNYFFIIPILWLVLWAIGVVMGVFGKCDKLGEWCFRCTWCPAMWIGATIMLIFSFFSIISVGWADFCVNLDEFEADPRGSRLGVAIANVSGGAGGGMDPIDIVNACWTGSDLLGVLNMTDTLDWSSFRENLTDVINIDVTDTFTLDGLDSFISEINLMNTDEFQVEGDKLIADLNDIGSNPNELGCHCECGYNYSTPQATFTREKLRNDTCYNATSPGPWDCWFWDYPTVLSGGYPQACITAFVTAYTYVQAEKQLTSQTQKAIDDIKNQTAKLISAYSGLFGTAVDIERSVQNISCSIDPIFERFDALITNYSNCGFLGDAYGGFKNVGCVLLFTDMYWISCAMMVIAFFSILVVCLGFMTQYSWHPAHDKEDDDIGSKLVKRASQKFVTTPLGKQMSARASASFPGLSASLRDLQVGMGEEMQEGAGDDGSGSDDGQHAPPTGVPPGQTDDMGGDTEMGMMDTGGGGDGDMGVTEQDNNGGGDVEMPQVSAPTDFDADESDGGDVL